MRPRSLLASAAAAALVASLASAAPAFASTFRAGPALRSVSASPAQRGATQHSQFFAGYVFPVHNPKLSERATIFVPSVKCGKRDQAVEPSVAMDDVASKATTSSGLFVACHKGKALYIPVLVLDGVETNYKMKVHAGDKVAFSATEGPTKGTVTFTDLTTKAKKTKTSAGVGSDQLEFPSFGDLAVFEGTSMKPLGVPDFGKLDFSGAKLLGQGIGKYPAKTRLRFDRYNSTDTVLQIHTGGLSSDGLSFKTLFKHS